MKNNRKHLRGAVFLVTILFLVLVILYSGLQILESAVLRPGQGTEETFSSKTITRDGTDYFPRQDLTTMLIMGIDQFGPVEDSGSYTNSGATDVNILLVFDETDHVVHAIHLNRDTMLEMPVLGIGGRQAGTAYGQLALAHTYGSGLDDSCRNTCQAVSALLGGIDIHYYLSMNMDAISIFNDAVGGVTVNNTVDFSLVDPTIGLGRVTLNGSQAVTYVRARRDVGDQKNVSRIQRHITYMNGFVEAFRAQQENGLEAVLTAYEEVQPYIVTNCSVNALTGMLERYGDFQLQEVISLEGENVLGDEYYEFYPDEEKLDALILRLLFAPKK